MRYLEWYNDTFAARFHFDTSQPYYKPIKEELVHMRIPPIHSRYDLAQDWNSGQVLGCWDETISKDWNILWACVSSCSNPTTGDISSNIQWLLDTYLTKASILFQKQLGAMIPSMESIFHRKRLATRPLRNYEDLMIQRLLLSYPTDKQTTIWRDIQQYYQNKKNQMKHIRLSILYTQFFQQLVFQRGWLDTTRQQVHRVWSNTWEYDAPTNNNNKQTNTEKGKLNLRIYLWGIWFRCYAPRKPFPQQVVHGIVQEMHLFRKQCKIRWLLEDK